MTIAVVWLLPPNNFPHTKSYIEEINVTVNTEEIELTAVLGVVMAICEDTERVNDGLNSLVFWFVVDIVCSVPLYAV